MASYFHGQNSTIFTVSGFLFLHVSQKSTQAVLNPDLVPVETAEIGTPLEASSTKTYTLQWDGSKIVNTLHYERGVANGANYEINHLTGTINQWGIIGSTDSADGGSKNFPTTFGAGDIVMTYTLKEVGSIDGPAGTVGVNYWFDAVSTTGFTHNRDNDIDAAEIHWTATGNKP